MVRRVAAFVASRLSSLRVMGCVTGLPSTAAPAASAPPPAAASVTGPAVPGRARAVPDLALVAARIRVTVSL